MGSCASKPKASDIVETSAKTEENVVVETKNVEPEAVSQEKADEVVAEKKEESAGAEAEPQKEAEAEPAKPFEAEPALEAVKTDAAQESAVETVDEKKASGETEPPPKQEEAAAAKTNEEPLVTL